MISLHFCSCSCRWAWKTGKGPIACSEDNKMKNKCYAEKLEHKPCFQYYLADIFRASPGCIGRWHLGQFLLYQSHRPALPLDNSLLVHLSWHVVCNTNMWHWKQMTDKSATHQEQTRTDCLIPNMIINIDQHTLISVLLSLGLQTSSSTTLLFHSPFFTWDRDKITFSSSMWASRESQQAIDFLVLYNVLIQISVLKFHLIIIFLFLWLIYFNY